MRGKKNILYYLQRYNLISHEIPRFKFKREVWQTVWRIDIQILEWKS